MPPLGFTKPPEMKRIFFTLCLAFAGMAAQANSLTVQNLLSNTVTMYFVCVNPDGTSHSSNYVNLVPGPNVFANPTLIPGLAGTAAVNGRVYACFGVCNPYDLALGSPNLGGYPVSQNVPAGNDCNGSAFTMTWNEGNFAPYNAVILIF